MKYMLLIYNDEATQLALAADFGAVRAEAAALLAELTETGELIGGHALADPVMARTIRGTTVTEGPFVEAREYLAGTIIVECDTIERANEIAQRLPDARYCALEVRPLMNEAGMEM